MRSLHLWLLLVATPALAAPPPARPERKGTIVVEGPSLHPQLDVDHIYFIRSGDVRELVQRVSKRGGPPTTLARLKDSRLEPVLHSEWLYFAWDSELSRVPRAGGESEAVASGDGDIRALAADDSGVYFRDGKGIHRLAAKAREPKLLVKQTATLVPGELVLAEDALYFVVTGMRPGFSDLKRIPKNGGEVVQVAAISDDNIMHMIAHGDALYWSNEKLIRKLPKKGGEVLQVYRAQHGARVDLEDIQGNDAFFSEDGRGIFRVPLGGGEAVLISERGVEVAADETAIYVEETYPDGALRLVKYPR